MPSVSIITPVHNLARYLAATVDSVRMQSFADWEMLLVDDCSTDNSVEVAENLARLDPRVKLIRLDRNSGAAVARNAAIKAAAGRYIAFLDGDDLWQPDKLEKQLAFMRQKNAAFSYTAYRIVDEAGKEVSVFNVPAQISYRDLLRTNVVGCSTAVYDTAGLGKVYMPDIRKRQDFGLWLRLTRTSGMAHGLPEILASYRLRSTSLSSNKLYAALYVWKLYREVEKLPLWQSVRCFSEYAIRAFFKYYG
ncbi:MAG TPA: glycosyltransferase family 2 protein [Gammaproteobacteria bacterium]|nr:glycosyltransferase family 2 protein [Gammaproteobacteria bacterium]